MDITFFRYSKKPNSTAVPSGGSALDCQVFEPCDMLSPVVILAGESPERWNYAYIAEWNRYYFITQWRRADGLWYGYLDVDALASWRDAIRSTAQYVTRSASSKDGGIVDTLYPTKGNPMISVSTGTNPFLDTTGTYVVGVVGKETVFYALAPGEFVQLVNYIFSDAYADALVGGLWVDIYPELKANVNPLQYISSVRWYPLDIVSGQAVSRIPVGWVSCPVSGHRLSPTAVTNEVIELEIPKHPQSMRGHYLNLPPYSRYSLYIPPWGKMPLDSNFAAANTGLQARCIVDLISGNGILKIENSAQSVLVSLVATQIGVAVQLAHITAPGFGIGSVIQAAAGIGASVATGNMGGAALSALSAVGDAAASNIPSANTVGNPGGYAPFIGVPAVIGEFMPVVDADNDNQGSPLCKYVELSKLSGYTKISWPHLDIPALAPEISKIYSYMEGGFYLV